MPYHWELFQIGCSEVVFKLMIVEVRIKFDFMHVICMSSWAEWDGSDWLIKYPEATIHIYRSGGTMARHSNLLSMVPCTW